MFFSYVFVTFCWENNDRFIEELCMMREEMPTNLRNVGIQNKKIEDVINMMLSLFLKNVNETKQQELGEQWAKQKQD